MENQNLRGFINTLNLEAENLGLDDIQISQVPVSQMQLPEKVIEAVTENMVYITVSVKNSHSLYPPTGRLFGFGIQNENHIRLAYERASAFLKGIKFSREMQNSKSDIPNNTFAILEGFDVYRTS